MSRRPTVKQLEILRRLAIDGEFIHRCSHSRITIVDSYFFRGSISDRVSGPTIRAMLDRKWVEDFEDPDWRWRGSKYRITDEGRLQLNHRDVKV